MNIDSYFTQQTDVKKIILNHLDQATSKVYVAVAWFTDQLLFEKLIELQERGVSVELIITKHEFNTKSRNNYKLLKNGGFFAEVGNDEQLMHMKFCVIDYEIVISGSANWSRKAFAENNEEVTIVSGSYQRANDFIEEFDRLKELSGQIKKNEGALDLSKSFKYLKLIKALIDLGELNSIQPYIYELKHFSELQVISSLLIAGNYEEALKEIALFEKSHTQLIDVTAIFRAQIQSQIKLISYQIESLEIEKTEIETQIEQFNHRYILELNPLITKILALKKKIFKKLEKHGIFDDSYERINDEFKRRNQEYKEESKIDIPTLSEEETGSIKKMHREAVKYCHPDSTGCIYEDKIKAAEIFSKLTEAFKKNDLETVKHIWNELKNGNAALDPANYDQIELLRAKLETLKSKCKALLNDLQLLKSSKPFLTIHEIEDWDHYFENQKTLLMEEYEKLTKKYVTHE